MTKRKAENQLEREEKRIHKNNQEYDSDSSEDESLYDNLQDTAPPTELDTYVTKVIIHQHSIARMYDQAKLEKYKIDYEYYNIKLKSLIEERAALLESVPEFWLRVFLNHEVLSQQIGSGEIDIPLLNHLKDIKVIMFPPPDLTEEDEGNIKEILDTEEPTAKTNSQQVNGFRVEFYLRENDLINDKILWKELYYSPYELEKLSRVKQSGVQWTEKAKDYGDFDSFFSVFDRNSSLDEHIFLFVKEELYIDPVQYYLKPISSDDGEDDGEDDQDEEQ